MPDNDRMTWGFVLETVDVLERHGYHRSDNQHTGQAIGLPGDLVHVYEGSRDTRRSAYIAVAPSPPSAAQPPIRTGPDPVVLTSADASTVVAALDIAAAYHRGRAAACADQTCLTCQSRLRDAQAYDRVADQILHGTEASAAAQRPGPDRAEPARGQLQPPGDREAGP